MNFDQLFKHFLHLYGANNAVYITSLSERITLLFVTIGDLQVAVRKAHSKEMVANRLANVVSRAFAVAGHFWKLPLNEAMCGKYPDGKCGYCGKRNGCDCPLYQRPEHKETEPDSSQLLWTLRDHQTNLASLYGETNRAQGIEKALNRLFTEVVEISQLVAGINHVGEKAKVIMKEYAQEIADVFAWILAIGTILEIDVFEAVMKSYGSGCPTCQQNPCDCPKLILINGTVFHGLGVPSSKSS